MTVLTQNSLRIPEASRRLAGAWFLLALGSLGISALLALVLVAARTPFVGLGSSMFRTALVLHVDMAVLVWFLTSVAGMWVLAMGSAGRLSWGAFWLSTAGVLLLLLSPLLGEARPLLANYVPMLDSAIFQSALAAFFLGVIIVAAHLLLTPRPRGLPAWGLAARWSAVVMLLAALVFGVDYLRHPAWQVVAASVLDELTWSAGHQLQFMHVVMMMGAWSIVGERLLERVPTLPKALPWLLGLATLPALAGAVMSLAQLDITTQRWAFTELMRWGAWPVAVIFGAGLLQSGWSARGSTSTEEKLLLLSVLLFMVGCLVGAGIRGNATLSVPAHYHGTVGAVTLAYLLLARRLALAFGVKMPGAGWVQLLPLVYGMGIAVLVAGLAWSGWQGVVRKAPHAEILRTGTEYLLAMGLAGIGGFAALTAVLLFVVAMLYAIGNAGAQHAGSQERARVSPLLMALVPLAIVIAFALLQRTHGTVSEQKVPAAHAQEKTREEIALRFEQGVKLLRAKQYDQAIDEFQRVLQLAPDMPEAHVNLGFALLGKQQFAAAAASFDAATTLRPQQINAYFGMAESQEGLGNLRAAIEAMRAYVHLAAENDPFRVKAEAAIWEWREALEKNPAIAGPAKAPSLQGQSAPAP